MKIRIIGLTNFWPLALVALPLGAQPNLAFHRAAYGSGSVDELCAAHLVTDGSVATRWESTPGGQPWIYVDLGSVGDVEGVRLDWGQSFPTDYRIEVSEEGPRPKVWKEVQRINQGRGGIEEWRFPAVKARCVRILATHFPANKGCMLREFQVFGPSRSAFALPAQPAPRADGSLVLTGGAWKVQSAGFVATAPEYIASRDFDDRDWIPATVPGTVLASYLNAGAIPDPYFGNQQTQLSEGFFTGNDFWYRNAFKIPTAMVDKRLWLAFDGISWKADVYFNGQLLGRIDGSFLRKRFDVTALAKPGQTNHLAVLVHKVDNPGEPKRRKLHFRYENGGILGLDSPAPLATIGWNWLPTIPGRGTGIWNEVRLESTADVECVDPWVSSKVPSLDRAELTVKTELVNHADVPRSGVLMGKIGDLAFRKPYTLQPRQRLAVSLDKNDCPELALVKPKLWWPNGYGEPTLHTLKLSFEVDGKVSDEKAFAFGIREITSQVKDNILTLFVNGTKILLRGGNWGMEEALQNIGSDGYDLRVRLHRDANLNVIRNWVGMVGREAFYDACDKYGVLIWDDFWLANPVDGPAPSNDGMFMENVRDKVSHVRRHASVALYCGRNEGMPPDMLDKGMREATTALDGTRPYIPDSAYGVVTGLGPYDVMSPEWYFANRGVTLHSEQGIIAVPPVESMKAMLPEESYWPINDLWAIHDYQTPRMPRYTARMEQRYGKPTGLDDYCLKAQMLNMETGKAIYECLQSRQGSGLIVWMTQAAWPSLICQLYDHYFEPTAAFFGAKKACEPIHVLWDPNTDEVKGANNTPQALKNLEIQAQVYGLDGKLRWEKQARLDLAPTSGGSVFKLQRPERAEDVFFVKLFLKQDGKVLSENFYWSASQDKTCVALNSLPKVALKARATGSLSAGIEVELENPSRSVALMARLKVQNPEGERVLPVFYEDNYLSLLPGEKRRVRLQSDALPAEAKPKLLLEGWNIQPSEIVLK